MDVDSSLRNQAIPAFRFVVSVAGEAQAAFTECTLPAIEWEIQEVKEGGLNTYTHQLPGRRKAAKVILKNGVGKSELLAWYTETMGETFTRKDITVTLFDAQLKQVAAWTMAKAYPVKWTGPQFKSDDNAIAIQTLEFAGGEVTYEAGG